MVKKKLAVIVVSALLVESLTGCGAKGPVASFIGQDGIQNQQYANAQEVIDYYSRNMKVASITKRPAIKDTTAAYNTVDQNSKIYASLKDALQKIIAEYQKPSSLEMSKYDHDYMKAITDNMVLSNGDIKRVKEHGGYYYITVAYKVSENSSGKFKRAANYLGVDGTFVMDENSNIKIDDNYVEAVKKSVYTGYIYDKEDTSGEADDTVIETISDSNKETSAEEEEVTTEEIGTDAQFPNAPYTEDTSNDISDALEETEDGTEEDGAEVTEQETEPETTYNWGSTEENTDYAQLNEKYVLVNGDVVEKTGVNNIDRLEWDVASINDIAGTSNQQPAFIPDMDMVWENAGRQGAINGYGMYKQGKAGLSEFGFKQNTLEEDPGEIILTFVFSQNILKPDELIFQTAYINEYTSKNLSIETGEFGGVLSRFIDEQSDENTDALTEQDIINKFTGPSITVPTFLQEKISMVIDEFDRAVNDRNITALMDGEVIEDAGLGLHYAAYAQNTDLATFTSNIRRIVARKDNSYLLEVERTVEESPKYSGIVGQYRDTYFVVVRQEGTDFKYNDEFFVRRVTTHAPEVESQNTTVRRLVALNLANEVDASKAKDIKESLLNAITNTVNSQEFGENTNISVVFNSDRDLLTQDRSDYIVAQLKSQLCAFGEKVHCDYTITPVEWISGSEQQVEFITEEFFKFSKNGKIQGGLKAEKYYLVSHYGTHWYIDDVITLDTELLIVGSTDESGNKISEDQILQAENAVKGAKETFSSVNSNVEESGKQ